MRRAAGGGRPRRRIATAHPAADRPTNATVSPAAVKTGSPNEASSQTGYASASSANGFATVSPRSASPGVAR